MKKSRGRAECATALPAPLGQRCSVGGVWHCLAPQQRSSACQLAQRHEEMPDPSRIATRAQERDQRSANSAAISALAPRRAAARGVNPAASARAGSAPAASSARTAPACCASTGMQQRGASVGVRRARTGRAPPASGQQCGDAGDVARVGRALQRGQCRRRRRRGRRRRRRNAGRRDLGAGRPGGRLVGPPDRRANDRNALFARRTRVHTHDGRRSRRSRRSRRRRCRRCRRCSRRSHGTRRQPARQRRRLGRRSRRGECLAGRWRRKRRRGQRR